MNITKAKIISGMKFISGFAFLFFITQFFRYFRLDAANIFGWTETTNPSIEHTMQFLGIGSITKSANGVLLGNTQTIIFIAAAILLLVIAQFLYRRFSSHRPPSYQVTPPKRYESPSLARNAAFFEKSSPSDIPRYLLKDPFGPETSSMSLDERIGIAIQGSLESSRVIGVICFSFVRAAPLQDGDAHLTDRQATQILARRFRQLLRPTDFVLVTRSNEIAVFISLLSNLHDLRKISARLSGAVMQNPSLPHTPSETCAGLAIYPMDGYSGSELFTSARNRIALARGENAPMARLEALV